MNLGTTAQFPDPLRRRACLRAPIPEIAIAAKYLDDAASAHISEQPDVAEELIDRANMAVIREWTESLQGKASPYVQHWSVAGASLVSKPAQRQAPRMPTSAEKLLLRLRDGYHCRFCGIPVIRKKVRDRLRECYPHALPWGNTNAAQHAAFQAMCTQYDHVLPHARGGSNDLNNIVVTCAPCNYGRGSYTLEEVGLLDPRRANLSALRGMGLNVFSATRNEKEFPRKFLLDLCRHSDAAGGKPT